MNEKMLIQCPHCQRGFDLWQALTASTKDQLAAFLTADLRKEAQHERVRMQEQIAKELLDEHLLKDREKDSLIADLRISIENLRRRAAESSQQRQGEALETALADGLKQAFPLDEVTRVGKGRNGGDVIHVVRDSAGNALGRVLWESKNTHTFSPRWLSKLKEDAIRCSADLAVILTRSLPKNVQNFGQCEGIWITDYASHLSLALALRCQVIACAKARVSASRDGAEIKAYIQGPEFIRRVEMIVATVETLRGQLAREQQTVGKWWAERDKLINGLSQNLTAVSGSLEVVSGCSFGSARTTELCSAEPDAPEEVAVGG